VANRIARRLVHSQLQVADRLFPGAQRRRLFPDKAADLGQILHISSDEQVGHYPIITQVGPIVKSAR